MVSEQKRSPPREAQGGRTSSTEDDHSPGGSAEPGRLPARGGGYPDSCTPPEASSGDDPRLSDLRAIGLDRRWLDVARAIGVDAFLEAWRVLDSYSEESGETRLCIHRYRQWQRLQRNRLIQALADQRYLTPEIRRQVRARYRESLSRRHINRIIAEGRVAS